MKKTNKRTFVIGDIHGGHKALLQCLQRAKFDYKKDTLISLGDVADGWPEVVECFEELLKIKNFIMVMGNHDNWLLEWMIDQDEKPNVWVNQGGAATLASYAKHPEEIRKKHYEFLKTISHYYVDGENRLFVHGGLEIGVPIEKQHPTDIMWNRELVNPGANVPEYKEVFIGHTSTWRISTIPIQYGNVTCCDQGGGWEGKLSMMNIDTKEVFQSDMVEDLYPGEHNN